MERSTRNVEEPESSMTEPVKLTKPEMARLIEIEGWWRRYKSHPSCGQKPKVTASLIALGLVHPRGGKVAKSGRIMHHADAMLTELGRAAAIRAEG